MYGFPDVSPTVFEVSTPVDTLEVGGKEGFTTTVEPAPYTAWEWNYEDAWTHWNPSTNLVDKVPASEPLPATN